MSNLITEISILKSQIELLKAQIKDLQTSSDSGVPTSLKPYSVVGGAKDPSMSYGVDIRTNLGGTYGNTILWNDAEMALPPYGVKPGDPTEGYHQHTHSEFSGGALIINFVELVEYDVDFNTSGEYSPHCQQFWDTKPQIKKDEDGNEQKGSLFGKPEDPNLVWDKINKCWRFYAVYADDEEIE